MKISKSRDCSYVVVWQEVFSTFYMLTFLLLSKLNLTQFWCNLYQLVPCFTVSHEEQESLGHEEMFCETSMNKNHATK